MHKVEIHAPGAAGNPADILVDGEKVRGVTGYTLTRPKVSGPARLVLDLVVHETEIFGEAEVHISDRARETLIRFGWTPPPADMTKGGE